MAPDDKKSEGIPLIGFIEDLVEHPFGPVLSYYFMRWPVSSELATQLKANIDQLDELSVGFDEILRDARAHEAKHPKVGR